MRPTGPIPISSSPAYRSWATMKQRCDNPKNPAYSNYGGRGIRYSAEWTSFKIFLQDMGPRPAGKLLERKRNNEGYSKDNCVWATRLEQNRNTRVQENREPPVGVSFDKKRKRWWARKKTFGLSMTLYFGPDFFEAVCARKSWEAKQ